MNIYKSPYLRIDKQNDQLIQTWTDQNLSIFNYQKELINFIDLFHKVKPKKLVWDIKACKLIIPKELDEWFAEKVLLPIYKKGIRELIFTVSENIAVHRSIVQSLDKAKEMIQSVYLPNQNEAVSYAASKKIPSTIPLSTKMELNTDLNSFNVNLKLASNNLPEFLRALDRIKLDNLFVEEKAGLFYSLTLREVQIFKLIALGKTNRIIASELFIEESSVKTHRKNIKRKLKIKSALDIFQYARCFHII